jgi:hypothetical protein
MSFDVFLFKFARGESSELPRDAVLGLFQKHDFKQRGEGFYDIRLADGSEVEVQAGGLTSSEPFTTCTFFIRGGSDSIARLAFECAQATGGVLIPTMDQNPCIMVDVSQRTELPPDFTLPVVECRSAEDLTRLLRTGYQAWSRHRDQVARAHDRPNPAA